MSEVCMHCGGSMRDGRCVETPYIACERGPFVDEAPIVSISLPLAQRILAAVDRAADGLRVDVAELRAIRAELRAAVERKP